MTNYYPELVNPYLTRNSYCVQEPAASDDTVAYSVSIKRDVTKTMCETRVRISQRLLKLAFFVILTLAIYFLISLFFVGDCFEQFKKYECSEGGKNSKICSTIVSCLDEESSKINGKQFSVYLVLGLVALIFSYYTLDQANPLVKFNIIKANEERITQ